jgi:hypothetical protein
MTKQQQGEWVRHELQKTQVFRCPVALFACADATAETPTNHHVLRLMFADRPVVGVA